MSKEEFLDYKIKLDEHRMHKLKEKMEAKQAKLHRLMHPVKTKPVPVDEYALFKQWQEAQNN